jgi:class 3 adenylate cyclase/ligand-binding sensor domain-containing protein/predicted metal-dependent HD superfamily phosphohydrolase
MKKIFTYLIFNFILFLGFAQSNIRFKNLSITSGLSQSYVNDITQDPRGFIWICTQDGLNRFDGYSFEVFNADRIEGLGSNYFYCAHRTAEHIWFGTEKNLVLYDFKKDVFTAYETPKKFGDNRAITGIVETENGDILVLIENRGIYRFDIQSSSFQVVSQSFQDPNWTFMSYLHGKGLFAFSSQKGLVVKIGQKERFLWMPVNQEKFGKVVQIVSLNETSVLVIGKRQSYIIDLVSGAHRELYIHLELWSQGLEIMHAHLSDKRILYLATGSAGMIEVFLNENFDVVLTHQHREDIFRKNTLLSDLTTRVFQDKGGHVWVGSQRGASVFNPEYVGILGYGPSANLTYGLPVPSVWSFTENEIGNQIFIGHSSGVSRLDVFSKTFTHFYRNPDAVNRFLSDVPVLSLHRLAENKLLVGCIDGLYILEFDLANPSLYSFSKIPHDLEFYQDYDRVYSILKCDENCVWLGTKGGLVLLDLTSLTFRYPNGNFPSMSVKHIIRSKDGKFWGGTASGEVFTFKLNKVGEVVMQYAPFNEKLASMAKGAINSLWIDKRNTMWLGTYGSGLLGVDLKNNEIKVFDIKSGLPNNVVYGILQDNNHNLWLSTNKGISKFDPKTNKFINFTEKDGLTSDEFNTGAFFKSSKGDMYFGGIFGFNHFVPEFLKELRTDLRIFLTDLKISNRDIHPSSDGDILEKPIYLSSSVNLSYSDKNIYFRFVTNDLANAELIEYKYILEGNDDNYTFLGNDNSITFTSLSPGDYVLKIYAKSTYGEWGAEPLQVSVKVIPPFWVTWWFRLIAISVIVIVFLSVYRYRVEQQRRQMVRLEMKIMERTTEIRTQNKRIAEQNKEIEIQKRQVEEKSILLQQEKEKVEKLLLNILPEDTVRELSDSGTTRARAFSQVSVMFTDFAGFTTTAEEIEPIDLIDRLDMFFSRFDEIIEKWNIEKIKTVGDAYLCAGGMPIRSKENPIRTVLAGLEIQKFMKRQAIEDESNGIKPWTLRVGINTGEVVAGVIGKKRYAYDIWGASVNLAQRMEVNCKPGAVNISESTYELIEPYFVCTPRGKVMAKNSGLVNMYFVERIKPELSADEDGIVPNEQFWNIVHLHLYSTINYAKAERFIHTMLAKKLPNNLYYHSIWHTKDVTAASERLALMEGIQDEGLFLLKSAASYHDAGFIEKYDHNEVIGIQLAQEHLPKFGYSEEQIKHIEKLINATIFPHNPTNHLEEILCDADLDYLGRDDFWEISDKLRRELKEHGKINSDRKWDEIQVSFFNKHKYFTKTAIKLRQEKKDKHLQEIIDRLERDEYED